MIQLENPHLENSNPEDSQAKAAESGYTESANRARQLALLGILLQALYVLFGITAIIGVLIAHVQLERASGSIYHSQIRWQIITFWTGLFAYFLAAILWLRLGIAWPAWLAFIYTVYRIGSSIWFWSARQPANRII
jgi:uncharacterized membrane protein